MASTTTMTEWAESLARSFIPNKTSPFQTRKAVDHFTKSIKHHNHARANQFEVQERLIGLEEKFMVLNFDELSDLLRERRILLSQYQERWLPDALDLLLNLSRDSLKQDAAERLSLTDRTVPILPTFKWSDIEGDEPINRNDRVWKQPDLSDLSSDEDEIISSTAATSPASQKQQQPSQAITDDLVVPRTVFASREDVQLMPEMPRQILARKDSDKVSITMIQAIRETLFMTQGFPTDLFLGARASTALAVNPRFYISHLDTPNLHAVLLAAIEVGASANSVRDWVKQRYALPIMPVLQDQISKSMYHFDKAIAQLHNRFLPGVQGIASLSAVVNSLEQLAGPIRALQIYIQRIENQDAIGCLDVLYETICKFEIYGDRKAFRCFVGLFRAVFGAYLVPVDEWISHGELNEHNSLFFVQRVADQHIKSNLWHTWYTSSKTGPTRPPHILAELADRILAAGKTQAFLRHLGHVCTSDQLPNPLAQLVDQACEAAATSFSPFAPNISNYLINAVTSHLRNSTCLLQTQLQHGLGLTSTLSAFSHLYLSSSGKITSTIDTFLFSHIDRRDPSWNDRFLISDLLSESFANIPSIEQPRIIIHSQPLSPSTMRTAFLTVKPLENLAVDYILPWPVANIILPSTLPSYRRIALLLTQIRRAKHVLEHHALPALQPSTSFSSSVRVSAGKFSRPVREAEGVFLTLHTFVCTLYSHLTTCVIGPMTQAFQHAVVANGAGEMNTIDDLIALHATYLHAMDTACLTTPSARNVKVCRETIVEVLDLCLKFGFDIAKSEKRGWDVEEMVRVKKTARKSTELLVTGLRVIGRSAMSMKGNTEVGAIDMGEANEMLDLLASRLESCGLRR